MKRILLFFIAAICLIICLSGISMGLLYVGDKPAFDIIVAKSVKFIITIHHSVPRPDFEIEVHKPFKNYDASASFWTITLPANQAWTNTIDVQKGDYISLGVWPRKWGWNSRVLCTGEGDFKLQGEVYPDAPAGSLLVRVSGDEKNIYWVGNQFERIMEASGKLQFCINDIGGFSDNQGGLEIHLSKWDPKYWNKESKYQVNKELSKFSDQYIQKGSELLAKENPKASSVQEIGRDRWRINLVHKAWVDTRIPVIANQYFIITSYNDDKWQTKIAGRILQSQLYNKGGELSFLVSEEPTSKIKVNFDFQETLKFKIDTRSKSAYMTLFVEKKYVDCPYSSVPYHSAYHIPAEKWEREMEKNIGETKILVDEKSNNSIEQTRTGTK